MWIVSLLARCWRTIWTFFFQTNEMKSIVKQPPIRPMPAWTKQIAADVLETASKQQQQQQPERYERGRLLGTGKFSKVYQVTDQTTRRQYAMKITLASNASELVKQHLRTEIELLRTLGGKHPHICSLHDNFEESGSGNMHVVMELAEGDELLEHVNRNRGLSEKQARLYTRQLVSALRFVHQNGWVHRDVKLDNVIVVHKRSSIFLVDWGFAHRWTAGKRLTDSIGTLNYAAPELITRIGYEGPEVDVWSLGVLVYCILAGWLPFEGKTDQDTQINIRTGTAHAFPHDRFSEQAVQFIQACLRLNGASRASMDMLSKHSWLATNDD